MKYAVLALLGLTTVNANVAKKPENITGGQCGEIIEKDKCTGKDVTKTMTCDYDRVCATLDITGYTG